MTRPAAPAPDPVALVDSLDADTIRAQMAALDERRRALSVLLRAALVRERAAHRRTPKEGGPHRAA